MSWQKPAMVGTFSYCLQPARFQDIYLCLNRVLQATTEPTHTHPPVPRQSQTPELTLVPPASVSSRTLNGKALKMATTCLSPGRCVLG